MSMHQMKEQGACRYETEGSRARMWNSVSKEGQAFQRPYVSPGGPRRFSHSGKREIVASRIVNASKFVASPMSTHPSP